MYTIKLQLANNLIKPFKRSFIVRRRLNNTYIWESNFTSSRHWVCYCSSSRVPSLAVQLALPSTAHAWIYPHYCYKRIQIRVNYIYHWVVNIKSWLKLILNNITAQYFIVNWLIFLLKCNSRWICLYQKMYFVTTVARQRLSWIFLCREQMWFSRR